MKKLPLLLSIAMSIGILIGTFLANHFSGNRINIINTGTNKLNYLLQLIDNSYVDTVDINQVVDEAIPSILSELDPHSAYFNASDAEAANEDLRGSFSGIGIQYRMEHDTVMVMSVIHGGPAEKVGILSGDRIITAGKKNLCKLESTEVQKYIKGKKGTHVKLTIVRRGHTKPLTFDVERGDIPVYTIDASYMIEPGIGYIRVKSFGEQTYAELLSALAKLNMRGMKSLILDLRGNRGGYMHIAMQMVNEFLPSDQLILYTEGRKSPREDYHSDGRGSFKELPIVVLVDEMSASSSEIFAGAIQDNDRGTIIGRRTFGKGLVQQSMNFRDGSTIRLTVSRYYTPSGRCIQKPYQKGHGEDYENELLMRYERGEFFSEDSIGLTTYYKQAAYTGLIAQYAFEITDRHRAELQKLDDNSQLEQWMNRKNLIDGFATWASAHGLQRRNLMLRQSQRLFRRAIYGGIIYNTREMEDYLIYLNQEAPTVIKALDIIHQGKTYPSK